MQAPIDILEALHEDKLIEIRKHLKAQIAYTKSSLLQLHTTKIQSWRRIWEGMPRQETKTFPWRNASNVVIQLVGQHCDTLLASVLSAIYDVSPVYVGSIIGNWDKEERAEEQRAAMEEFMSYCALEPEELDLYRVEYDWFGDAIALGTSVMKSPFVKEVEYEAVSNSGKAYELVRRTRYEGPRPEKIRFEDFLITPNAKTLKDAAFKGHIVHLLRNDLIERKETKAYKSEAVDKVLETADRNGPTPQKLEELRKLGVVPTGGDDYLNAEYDIYECWFSFFLGGKKVKLIVNYHDASDTILKGSFNFYPDNEEVFVAAHLGYGGDTFHKRGFAEMLKHYQEEVTAGHNQRVDNRTLANCSVLRVDSALAGKLDANFGFYPNAIIPAAKDGVETLQLGSMVAPDIEGELMTLRLAADRSGVDPGSGGPGLGTGTVGKTSGTYSSMGTMSVMQERNQRKNINITDMKYAHIKAGRLFAKIYAEFGIGKRAEYFGTSTPDIEKALDSYKSKRLGLSIRAASAAVNKEVEKQNNLLLSTIMQRHYTAIGQLIQATQNQQIEPTLKAYMTNVIDGSNALMEQILQSFGFTDKSRLLPKVEIPTQGAGDGQQPAGTPESAPPGSNFMGQFVPTAGVGSQSNG